MNREEQRNMPGGWQSGLAHALAAESRRPAVEARTIRPYRAKRQVADTERRRADAEQRRARRNAKRAENARRQREGQRQ